MRFGLTLAAVGMAGAMLAGCGERVSWRQKLTLEVETPDGIVTGTGVVQIRMRWLEDWQRFASANSVGSDVRGEAVVVEVAPGRYLFALVSWASYGLALKAFKEGDESPRQTSTRLQALRETRVLPRENYPRLVTFGHIGSPQTVRRVDPDNLAATFGPGYRLKSITLEITDAPVTRGEVETVLGWLGEHPETPLFPIVDPKDFSFAAKLRQGEFIRR